MQTGILSNFSREIIRIALGNSIFPWSFAAPLYDLKKSFISRQVCIAAIERQYHYDDETLVRHIYDLNAIKQSGRINEVFFTLAKIIVNADAKQFKNQHPEYFNDPATEIRQ